MDGRSLVILNSVSFAISSELYLKADWLRRTDKGPANHNIDMNCEPRPQILVFLHDVIFEHSMLMPHVFVAVQAVVRSQATKAIHSITGVNSKDALRDLFIKYNLIRHEGSNEV